MTRWDCRSARTDICINCMYWVPRLWSASDDYGVCSCDESDHCGHALAYNHAKCPYAAERPQQEASHHDALGEIDGTARPHYEIFETSGPDTGRLIGYLRLSGCEPCYQPSGRHDWMDLEHWRNWTGRTLTDLRIERIRAEGGSA